MTVPFKKIAESLSEVLPADLADDVNATWLMIIRWVISNAIRVNFRERVNNLRCKTG